MNAHIIKLLNKNDSLYAIEHQGRLVVLCNVDNMTFENHLDFIKPIIHNSGYYGGSSNIFTNLCDAPHFLLQAMLTFQSDSYRIGEISSCQEHIFPYMLHILHTNARMSLIHPALLTLSQYDEEHQSNYCHVLYTYLKNQCNQTETANILSMHRSSLLRKLNKILQITDVDLSDYVTRIHLLISFELNKL